MARTRDLPGGHLVGLQAPLSTNANDQFRPKGPKADKDAAAKVAATLDFGQSRVSRRSLAPSSVDEDVQRSAGQEGPEEGGRDLNLAGRFGNLQVDSLPGHGSGAASV